MEKVKMHRSGRLGRILGGIVIIGVGKVLLLRQLGFEFPEWVFSWPMLLIAFGLYIGARHTFCHNGWLFPVIAGTLFLIDRIYVDIQLSQFIWPIVIISAGLLMMFSSQRKKGCGNNKWEQKWKQKWDTDYGIQEGIVSSEDIIDSVTIFGGVKKNITSKNFKGGEIVACMGGAEINLSEADIEKEATLEVTAVLGGIKLIIPPHWQLKSELVTVMGGIDDKRPQSAPGDIVKTIILRGTAVLGGIDIKSY